MRWGQGQQAKDRTRREIPWLIGLRGSFRCAIRQRFPRSLLPRSHPWTVWRIWRLHQVGLLGPAPTAGQTRHPQEVA